SPAARPEAAAAGRWEQANAASCPGAVSGTDPGPLPSCAAAHRFAGVQWPVAPGPDATSDRRGWPRLSWHRHAAPAAAPARPALALGPLQDHRRNAAGGWWWIAGRLGAVGHTGRKTPTRARPTHGGPARLRAP